MSAAFTPGPWQWFPSVSKDRPAVIDTAVGVVSTNDTIIAEVSRGKQFEANAHLIAAAPELYDTLLAVVSEFGDSKYPEWNDAIAALAKARGAA